MADKSLNYIGGKWVEAAGKETVPVLNPANGKTIGVVPKAGVVDAEAAIDAARDAYDKGPWGRSRGRT